MKNNLIIKSLLLFICLTIFLGPIGTILGGIIFIMVVQKFKFLEIKSYPENKYSAKLVRKLILMNTKEDPKDLGIENISIEEISRIRGQEITEYLMLSTIGISLFHILYISIVYEITPRLFAVFTYFYEPLISWMTGFVYPMNELAKFKTVNQYESVTSLDGYIIFSSIAIIIICNIIFFKTMIRSKYYIGIYGSNFYPENKYKIIISSIIILFSTVTGFLLIFFPEKIGVDFLLYDDIDVMYIILYSVFACSIIPLSMFSIFRFINSFKNETNYLKM